MFCTAPLICARLRRVIDAAWSGTLCWRAGREEGEDSCYHCLIAGLVTSGLSLVRFVSRAQNLRPFGGAAENTFSQVLSGLRLSDSLCALPGGRWALVSPSVLLVWVSHLPSRCGLWVRVQRAEPSPPDMSRIVQGPGWGLTVASAVAFTVPHTFLSLFLEG